jgi:L-ascorbate metabolism protein UlaG (beta-lactamase superfamily)
MIERAQRAGNKYLNPVPTKVGSPSILPKILWRYLTNKAERTPIHPLGPFHTDPELYQQPPAGGLRLTWMGHSSTLIELDGVRILVDPMWDERAAPVSWAGPKRFFPAPLALEALPPLDVILISHDHYDHLGAQTVRSLAALQPAARWVTPLGVGPILTRFGVPPACITQLDWTVTLQAGPLKLTALPARHFSGRSLWNRFETLWASFVLEGPQHRIYYGADSGEWAGFPEIARTYGPFDLIMLEIGAYDPLWSDIHMGPDGAAQTFAAMNGAAALDSQSLLMPIHWGLFDLALHAWRQPIERLMAIDGIKLWTPTPGQPTEVVKGIELRSTWWRPKLP